MGSSLKDALKDAGVTPEVAPEDAGAVEPQDVDAGTLAPTTREQRAAEAREQASQARESRYVDEHAPVDVPGSMGVVGVVRSKPNAQGHTFLYVQHAYRGRESRIPLIAIEALQEAGEV